MVTNLSSLLLFEERLVTCRVPVFSTNNMFASIRTKKKGKKIAAKIYTSEYAGWCMSTPPHYDHDKNYYYFTPTRHRWYFFWTPFDDRPPQSQKMQKCTCNLTCITRFKKQIVNSFCAGRNSSCDVRYAALCSCEVAVILKLAKITSALNLM